MTPRIATSADADAIAAIHVQAWDETYRGLLPASEFARRDLPYRQDLWRRILSRGQMVSYLPRVGFAQVGQNRHEALQANYPYELYCLYTLRKAHGSGSAQALMAHVMPHPFQPFTAEVLQGNNRAQRFYEKIGGIRIGEATEVIDGMACTHITLGWSVPIQLDI